MATRELSSTQLRLRENQLFLALSVVVGVLGGLSAVVFALCIDRVSRELFGLAPSAARLFLVPTLVSIVTGVLLARWFPHARGSGVPQTKMAYQLRGGVIPFRVAVGKFITGVLCVGSGHSMGREGPSVQIGASIASTIGRWVGVSPDRIRALVPVGAAGALSAAFNTPVAAVLFSLEEIIGSMNAAVLGSTVVASVASVVVERAILGNEPLFRVPAYQLVHPAELLAYAVLGVVGGGISVVFCKVLLRTRLMFAQMPAWSRTWQPALGGALLGGILLYRPEVMGVGYDVVDQALNGHMLLTMLVLLCVVKMVATIVSYASGNAGGIFAPTLFLGAMAGGAVGTVVHAWAPFPTAGAGAYALVGMGTLFAGIIRAPMTSVFMVFEITQDYQILVPLMVANLLSFVISKHWQPVPVYHALLLQDGVHLPASDEAEARSWTVRDVMSAPDDVIDGSADIATVAGRLRVSGKPGVLILDDSRLVGLAWAEAVLGADAAGRGAETVRALATPPATHVHADHGLEVMFERWSSSGGMLPVVARDNVTRVEGVVTRDDIARFIHGSESAGGRIGDSRQALRTET